MLLSRRATQGALASLPEGWSTALPMPRSHWTAHGTRCARDSQCCQPSQHGADTPDGIAQLKPNEFGNALHGGGLGPAWAQRVYAVQQSTDSMVVLTYVSPSGDQVSLSLQCPYCTSIGTFVQGCQSTRVEALLSAGLPWDGECYNHVQADRGQRTTGGQHGLIIKHMFIKSDGCAGGAGQCPSCVL